MEIEDQVEAVLHMANTTDYIDIKRVAIHGWSYGKLSSFITPNNEGHGGIAPW